MPRRRAPKRRYSTTTAAALLHRSTITLYKWRKADVGPRWWIEDGRVWYDAADVDAERERLGLGPTAANG